MRCLETNSRQCFWLGVYGPVSKTICRDQLFIHRRSPSELLEGNMKNTNEQSLRCQVEKWLAPAPAIPVHVTEFSRTRWGGRRYVRVETSPADGARALFFFRHDDGNWCVFPPTADRRQLTTVRPVSRVVAAASYVLSPTRPLLTSPPSSDLPIDTNG